MAMTYENRQRIVTETSQKSNFIKLKKKFLHDELKSKNTVINLLLETLINTKMKS